jgi:hypothetical protein
MHQIGLPCMSATIEEVPVFGMGYLRINIDQLLP